ncbi:MAG TPA: hypothetical protein VKV20_12050 [Ktedonobacteraceae bacterium]|jgi:hypothetical protein|nr:hypothetical protein [Ktedonobacteraceae bacterium]
MSLFASMPCHIIPGQEFLSIRFQMVGLEELPNAIAQLATPRYLQGRVAGLYS